MKSKSIRVAMIAPPWLPVPPKGYGGIENVIDALVPELMKLNVKVELFTTGDSTLKATKTHYLYETGQYQHIHKPQYDALPISIAHLLFATNIIRGKGSFDIIHDHTGFLGSMFFANACADLPPVLNTLHGPPFTTPDRLDMGIPDNLPMWRQFTAKQQKLYLVGISHTLIEGAPVELKPLLLQPVYNAVDFEQFPFVTKKDDYFITLARFHPDKGQAIAVRVCLELDYRLKLIGRIGDIDTPRKALLELANPLSQYRNLTDFRYFSDQIFPYLDNRIEYIGDFNGETAGKRKMECISHARALLNPIQWDEPFGMAVIEALACGTPVVAMNRGAMPEIIEHGVNGFLAKTEADFKKYMQRVDEIDPAACRASVEKKFSAEVMAQAYLDRYHQVLAKQT